MNKGFFSWSSDARRGLRGTVCALLLLSAGFCFAAAAQSCRKVELRGEVRAGQEWRAAFGEGWVFRVLPIQPAKGPAGETYSGWDLVVDREQPAGFPDALLLATPPYNSINEHEVGTTFGLRAQDALGWNPRSFHFLTSPEALRVGQALFPSLLQRSSGAGTSRQDSAAQASLAQSNLERLMALSKQAAAGQFRILDARLAPGVSDAAPFAQNWALLADHTPHTFEPSANSRSTPLGELHWMRFSITLWLPEGWKTPPGLLTERGACAK
jgi:hypothetical protein